MSQCSIILFNHAAKWRVKYSFWWNFVTIEFSYCSTVMYSHHTCGTWNVMEYYFNLKFHTNEVFQHIFLPYSHDFSVHNFYLRQCTVGLLWNSCYIHKHILIEVQRIYIMVYIRWTYLSMCLWMYYEFYCNPKIKRNFLVPVRAHYDALWSKRMTVF